MNFGIMDQQFGLQWVSKNIKQFGGNSENILIFGESAGGGSVAFHLTLPDSYPYYHKALLESPGPWVFANLTGQLQVSEAMIQATDCATVPKDKLIDCLRNIPAEDLLDTWTAKAFPTSPIVDGMMIKESPVTAFYNNHFNTEIPIIFGSNLDEGLLFGAIFQIQLFGHLSESLTEFQFIELLAISGITQVISIRQLQSWYPATNDYERYLQFARIAGDFFIDCGVISMGDSIVKYSSQPTWRYLFTHNNTNPTGPFKTLGSTHGSEIPYVFGDSSLSNFTFTPEEQDLSNQIQKYLQNFHMNGNPNDKTSVTWPLFSGEANNSTFIWDFGFGVVGDW
eukprot:CAMPEP_0174273498 /NCGR_PEP_ID=MMETSP0439-20130205/54717_1 /TAXON_ID=0 /ORGANISM="Stereomyxa ramosa, Strain Chinc5" /LENGTH=337 /DNA_ID=CAMNT_0015364685 /DNA_START=182 /DNA_END=1192 /DNA_ORIENTATION=-